MTFTKTVIANGKNLPKDLLSHKPKLSAEHRAQMQALADSITKKSAAHAELRNLFEQGEAATQRSLEEVKWSLINMIGQLDAKRAV